MRQEPTTPSRDLQPDGASLGGWLGVVRAILILVGGTMAISIVTYI